MTDDQIYGLVVQGGIGATALLILGKVALKVADRMIAAIDALSTEARDTGKATVEALSSFAERLSYIEGKIAGVAVAADITGPVQQQWPEAETSEVRRAAPARPRSEPSSEGAYGPVKPRR